MRLSKNQLSIVVNPFAAPLSAEGRCMALCAADPAEGGARYIGARTVAKPDPSRRSMLAVGGKTLGRDKVSVSYDLRPVTVADTSYYRNAIKAGDLLEHANDNYNRAAAIITDPKVIVMLRDLARARLAEFEAAGGDPAQARAEWRAQGLASVADAIDPPTVAEVVRAVTAQGQEGAVEMKDLPRPFAIVAGMPAPPSTEVQASDRTEGAIS